MREKYEEKEDKIELKIWKKEVEEESGRKERKE